MGATPKPAQDGFGGSGGATARLRSRVLRALSRAQVLWLVAAAACFSLLHVFLKSAATTSAGTSTLRSPHARDSLLAPASTSSCEVCHLDPTDPACRYGLDNIRLSRAYEGSGHRLRHVLRRALAGEEIGVGVLGASVTAGHAVPPGQQRWEDRFFEDFQRLFPSAKLHVGAAPAMDSQFFAYCTGALVPMDLDIYLVELDINNDVSFNTLRSDDALMRSLLQLPHEPAVLRVSVFSLVFDELVRGASSALITSQFFDVPVISIRGFMLPHVIRHREAASEVFGLDLGGNPDYKEVCEVRRRDSLDSTQGDPEAGPWLAPEDLGVVPNLTLWGSVSLILISDFKSSKLTLCYQWTRPEPPRPVTPLCQSMASPRAPLVPLSHSKTFRVEKWNGKSAWTSSLPGSQIRLRFTGSHVGLFVYVTNGGAPDEVSEDLKVRRRQAPGTAMCWLEDPSLTGVEDGAVGAERNGDIFHVDSHFPNRPAAGFEFIELAEDLSDGEHILACEVSSETTSGGHKFRVQGIASF
ncbi:hypothetical protein JCM8202v2_004307 [Rhodotorula sphaerocarpa]